MLQIPPSITAIWEQNRTRIIIIAVLLLGAISVYGWQQLIIEPELHSLRTEQARVQQLVRQRKMESASNGIPISIAEQIAKNLHQFNVLIPEQTDFSVFIGELFAWAQQTGLDIHQISYKPKREQETEKELLRYGLNFSVKGKYAQIKKFIHLLENTPRIILIEKIVLVGTPANKSDQKMVNLQITLATYFQGGAE